MAAAQLKVIVDTLSCPIRSKLFKKPKYLPCHHFYCEQCLEKWKKRSKITCPECRKEWKVPAGGVKEFDNAFFVNHMVDQLVLNHSLRKPKVSECNECFKHKAIKAFCRSYAVEDLKDHHLLDLKQFTVSTAACTRSSTLSNYRYSQEHYCWKEDGVHHHHKRQ